MRYTEQYLSDLRATLDVPDIGALRGARILITGATGLIGSCVADAILQLNEEQGFEAELTLAGRSESSMYRRFSHWGDAAFSFAVFDALVPWRNDEPFDYIVHCASNAHPAAYVSEPVETMLANIVGTRSLLELLKRQGFGRLLYVSSSEVYGTKELAEPYSEDEYSYVDILNPRSCYPSSKRAAETLCAAFRAEYGVDFAVVRPGHVYGPCITEADSRAHAQFARLAAAGENIVMKSAGQQLRSYCYVVDCATAILAVLLQGVSGEAYNISNADSVVTIRQLAEMLAELGGVRVIFDLPSESEARGYNMMSCSALTSDKLESLGWKGCFDLKAGCEHMLEAL